METIELINESKELIKQYGKLKNDIRIHIIDLLKKRNGIIKLENIDIDYDVTFTASFFNNDSDQYIFAGAKVNEYDDIILLGISQENFMKYEIDESEEYVEPNYASDIEEFSPWDYDQSELIDILKILIDYFSEN